MEARDRSVRFTPGESPPASHWMGGWVRLRAGLDAAKKNLPRPGIEPPPPDRPVRSYTDYLSGLRENGSTILK
jgi:hypothetical protein